MEEEEALAEFDFLVSEQGGDDGRTDGDGSEWTKHTDWPLDKQKLSMQIEQYKKERIRKHDNAQRPRKTDLQAMIATLGAEEDDVADTEDRGDSPKASNEMMMRFPPGSSMERHLDSSALGLGDLADITVSNDETDSLTLSFDLNAADNNARKTWNAKYTLRSHFDGVRALVFHPVEPVLLTASEDHTMKLWNLQKTVPTKKATALDVEPVYTFRAHQGPVLCVAMSATGEECYSGGMDSTIRCWNLPSSNIDPYDSYDSSILQDTLVAHTDAVWGIAIHSTRVQLLSCSADSTVRLWTPGQQKLALNNTFLPPTEGDGVPTCIDFLANDSNRMMVAYSSGNCYVFDLSTGQHVVKFDSPAPDTNPRINKILSHPTLPVAISAHEDRSIKFYDTTNGELMHSMVAHLDAVTSLAIDPNGLYLLSGSHDNSIRLWSMESKTCVQEITSHRKKLDESVFDVAFHPSKPYIASAGADGVAKVLV
ncbi:STRN3 [Bugula neritina]|uniref:STRN3 n=1 Tax=Bugula neritina TaxID=10212 RepID=A0A7J7JCD3_BUGNE|nr:STRN3 [Bugula neritina]